VLPSYIDIHACSKCIADLLLIAKVRRDEYRIGVVANRVKRNTLIYQSLLRFLESLRIPVITTIRDSQNYVRASELGVGVFEMKRYLVASDLEDWGPLLHWLHDKEVARAGGPAGAAGPGFPNLQMPPPISESA
jgi:chromosome partitioning protein